MNLEVLTKEEYRKKLRSQYWLDDLDKYPDTMGITHYHSNKAYVLIDIVVRDLKTIPEVIHEISTTCVHELLHLANIGCGKMLEEETIKELEGLLMTNVRFKKVNTIEV